MNINKLEEIWQELRDVALKDTSLVEVILLPLLFVIVNYLTNINTAIFSATSVGILFILYRVFKGQRIIFTLGGMAGIVGTYLLTVITGRSETYFLPTLVGNTLPVIISLVSLLAQRPMVAYTSYIARRWPLNWYWHPKVKPAYNEVTIFWFLFFVIRISIQIYLFSSRNSSLLALFNLLGSWPAMIILLILSYLYGIWRLNRLKGPSVQEFMDQTPPPWQGQLRGF